MVSPEKKEELEKKMEDLGLFEEDIIEKFILGSGAGGQKINKTSSCVYLKHLPSGIEVKCQQERSRDLNRFLARRELCKKWEEKIHHTLSEKAKETAKIRKQKQRRSRKTQNKLRKEKALRSTIKDLRGAPDEGGDV